MGQERRRRRRDSVAVLRGAGPVFCAGADVKWMAKMIDYSREENLADAHDAAAMLLALDELPVPLIGRDPRRRARRRRRTRGRLRRRRRRPTTRCSDSRRSLLGILPAMISPYVVRKIGLSAARELCLSGARFSAARAKEIGLVHEVVPAEQLDDAVERHVAAVPEGRALGRGVTKRLLRDVHGRRPADVMALTVDAIANQRVSPEGQEGLRAFVEKRPPAWTPLKPPRP